MLNSKIISKIFFNFLNNTSLSLKSEGRLNHLVKLNIKINWKLWNLEDSARINELGSKHIARTKQEIDQSNQIRNDLIRKIDIEIANQLKVVPLDSQKQFYSESPGMIIDRLAILCIKLSVTKDLLLVIREKDLKEEYRQKENIILRQIDRITNFLNLYFTRLKHKEVFFEVQQPMKIYNDKRIKKYIKILKQQKKST